MTLAPDTGELGLVASRRPVEAGSDGACGAGDGVQVTAVLVCHDGEQWLARALRGLALQHRAPDRVVAVDVGSRDGTRALLDAARTRGEVSEVVEVDRRSGFGASVAAALAHAGPPVAGFDRDRFHWLLHDDCAPEPGALAALLATAAADPSAGVLGPKLVGGRGGRSLLEVGVSISAGARRETGLEPDELDQGQRDGVHDVLAVSTAGMLVRADVWQRLGGLDPALPLFRDDLDLGWRARSAGYRVVCTTDAVVRHAEAARRGLRPLAAVRGRALRADRQAGLRALLLNSAPWLLPVLLVRLVAASCARALALVLAGAPRAAATQLVALAGALGRPDLLVAGRWRRWRLRSDPHAAVRPYLARPGTTVRLVRDAAGAVFAPGAQRERRATPWQVVRPPLLLVAALGATALWSGRDLLGRGRVVGGAAGVAPGSLGDLLHALTGSWQPVGLGRAGAGPDWLAPFALLSAALGGRPAVALDVVLLGAVPLAGLAAYVALAPLVAGRGLRAWAAGAYALLPAVVGAGAAGRVGTAVAAVLLPPTARLAACACSGRSLRWQSAAGAGLLLAVVSAGAPVVWALAAAGALVVLAASLARPRRLGGLAARLALALAVPVGLLLPQARALASDPTAWTRWVGEAGWALPGLADARLDPWDVLLLHPGGPGAYPLVLCAPLLAAALAALLLPGRRAGAVRVCWALALPALAVAWLTTTVRLPGPVAGSPVPAWPGASLLVAGAALVVAAALGAEGARERLRGTSFGWRQLGCAALALAAGLAPVGVAAAVLDPGVPGLSARGSALHRTGAPLPSFVSADLAGPEHPRALVLSGTASAVRWSLDRGQGAALGSEAGAGSSAAERALGAAVADLVSGRGGSSAAHLPGFAVRYVVLRAPLDPALLRALDGTPGLARTGRQDPDALWEVAADRTAGVAARLRLTDASGATTAALESRRVGATDELAPGPAGRLLVLAEPADGGWRASVDGTALEPVPAPASTPWAQAFAVPAGGGTLHLHHSDAAQRTERSARLVLLGVVLLLCLPLRSRRGREAAA
ncbi:GT2 family glycosyltransferase [Motilibacter peucedani]|uniref:GT2 family glycosyltransferase n=1 Tax=Motilibacter peucedani TaxID=598650 RepID=A0A420XM94_9ACTN|nr:glycosyltransferase family 2 protein [Motilibacter peucedani]RKS71428.1 GT2 family glycosyltransferase [Motilibacter peucedani]